MIRTIQPQQTVNQPVASQPTLAIGDIVAGKVIKQVAKDHFLVNFHGKSYSVQSHLNLLPGNFVLLQLQDIGEQLSFKLLSTFAELNESQLAQSLEPLLISQDHQFAEAFIRMSIRYHLPVNIEQLRSLKKMYEEIRTRGNISESDFLLPYFFQNYQVNSRLLSDRFLMLRWFWGQFQLRKSLQEWKDKKAAEEAIEGGDEESPLLNDLAGNLQSQLSAENIVRWLLREAAPEQEDDSEQRGGLDLIKWIHQVVSGLETGGEEELPELPLGLLNSLIFIGFQLALFQKSIWCCLPIFIEDRETLVFLRRQNLDEHSVRYSFKFQTHPIRRQPLQIRGTLQDEQITIHFEHPDQEFCKLAEDNIPLLRKSLHRLGLQEIHVHTRQAKKQDGFFDNIIPKAIKSLDKLV